MASWGEWLTSYVAPMVESQLDKFREHWKHVKLYYLDEHGQFVVRRR